MCVCMFLCCVVLCVGRGLALDWSPNQGVLPNVCGSRNPLRKAKVCKRTVEASWKKNIYINDMGIVLFQRYLWVLSLGYFFLLMISCASFFSIYTDINSSSNKSKKWKVKIIKLTFLLHRPLVLQNLCC
jgi:hypothetical protein